MVESNVSTIPKGKHASEHALGGIDEIEGRITLCDTEVFSGNSPNPAAWTDLDLSAVVGANPALVVLRFYNSLEGNTFFTTRPNGETEFHNSAQIGFTSCLVQDTDFCLVLVFTDSNGIIEWYTGGQGVAATIDVVAYIK